MSTPTRESAPATARALPETSDRSRNSAEQLALAEAWRAVDNAVRSIFELAHSLERLRDAIRRVEAEPVVEFREVENARNRFRLE
jgi:hypothetical protein